LKKAISKNCLEEHEILKLDVKDAEIKTSHVSTAIRLRAYSINA
jgi:hypothetical protein